MKVNNQHAPDVDPGSPESSLEVSLPAAECWSAVRPKLSPNMLTAIQRIGFATMTPVQAQTIPLFLQSKDVVVEAMTGSGKTLAFLVSVVERILRREEPLKRNQVGAVIVSPTRELAIQIHKVLTSILDPPSPTTLENREGQLPVEENVCSTSKLFDITSACFVGGSTDHSMEDNIAHFREYGAHIIVATPGRLEELFRRAAGRPINLKECDQVVLDEADRLLDLGFTKSLAAILSHLPKQRRTGLFSATMTEALSELVRTGLRNPVRVTVKVENVKSKSLWRTPQSLSIGYIKITEKSKLAWLQACLQNWAQGKRAIVYFATCKQVEYFYKLLGTIAKQHEDDPLHQFQLYSLHGQQIPKRRAAVYESFVNSIQADTPQTNKSPEKKPQEERKHPGHVLLTTDVAARGLDIANVDVVLQFDAPTDPSMFLHRCGRAGRMNRAGLAIILLTDHESAYAEFMHVRKVPLEQVTAWTWGIGQHHPVQCSDFRICEEAVETLRKRAVAAVASDRELLDKSILAFTSYIRSYSANVLSYIFQLKNLDLVQLVMAYALIRVPNMPELRKRPEVAEAAAAYEASLSIDTSCVVYKDPMREKARQEREAKAQAAAPAKTNKRKSASLREAWSEQKEQKRKRLERQEKRARRKQTIEKLKSEGKPYINAKSRSNRSDQHMLGEQQERSGSEDSGSDCGAEDWAELIKETKKEREQKKAKHGSSECNLDFIDASSD